MKEKHVKQEHYIPQFALKFFANKDNKIPFTNIKKNPLKLLYASTQKVMQERDFYEIKDSDDNYVLRNFIEDKYSYLESKISSNIQKFNKIISSKDFKEEFVEIVTNNEWAAIESSLLLYIVTTLIRGKGPKNITYSKSKFSSNEQHILHLLMTTNQSVTAEFAKSLYNGKELEDMLYFIKNITPQGSLPTLLEHIMSNYQIRIYKTVGTKKLFLSDNPVIIQKFEDEDYILPISPDICIILVPINIEGNVIKIDTHVYSLSNDAVNKINEQSVLNTDRLIIISNEKDLVFIKHILSE